VKQQTVESGTHILLDANNIKKAVVRSEIEVWNEKSIEKIDIIR